MTRTIPADGVLFDCDGVLVDSLEAAAVAWDAWAAVWAPGYDFRTQIVHGMRAADTVATLVTTDAFPAAFRALEDEEVRGAGATAPIPGAVELTRTLPLAAWAVVTSATRRLAVARLTSAGHPEPRHLVSAEDVERGKPDPEPYLLGARRLGLAPEQCVVLEDAAAGVAAARAAGVGWVIGVGDHLDGAVVDHHVETLGGLRYARGELCRSEATAMEARADHRVTLGHGAGEGTGEP